MKDRKKKAIDFIGPSVQDLGLALEAEQPVIEDRKEQGETPPVSATREKAAAQAKPKTTTSGKSKPKVAVEESEAKASGDASKGAVGNEITGAVEKGSAGINSPAPRKENLYRRAIRDYLNRTLGDKEEVEFKISKMQQELGITTMTVYKHLRYLRKTEFEIKALQFCSLLKRREKAEKEQ
jgi:hypothetical protein